MTEDDDNSIDVDVENSHPWFLEALNNASEEDIDELLGEVGEAWNEGLQEGVEQSNSSVEWNDFPEDLKWNTEPLQFSTEDNPWSEEETEEFIENHDFEGLDFNSDGFSPYTRHFLKVGAGSIALHYLIRYVGRRLGIPDYTLGTLNATIQRKVLDRWL